MVPKGKILWYPCPGAYRAIGTIGKVTYIKTYITGQYHHGGKRLYFASGDVINDGVELCFIYSNSLITDLLQSRKNVCRTYVCAAGPENERKSPAHPQERSQSRLAGKPNCFQIDWQHAVPIWRDNWRIIGNQNVSRDWVGLDRKIFPQENEEQFSRDDDLLIILPKTVPPGTTS